MDRIQTFRDHHHVPLRLALLLAALSGAACFSPEFPDGTVPCGANGECPSGLECRAGTSLCFRPGGNPSGIDGSITVDGAPGPDMSIVIPDAAPTVDGDLLVDADPPADARTDAGPSGTVSVVFLGTGGGMVTLNGMTCASDCSLSFPLGTPVTLTPMTAPNSSFGGWGGACSGSAACVVVADAAGKTVEATFNQITQLVQLNITTVGPGTVEVTPPGSSCGPSCYVFERGTPITLTPRADTGFSVIGWMGANCEVVGAMPCLFAINSSVTVTGRFCDAHRVVDGTNGSDNNAGTCVAPYKTVTKALLEATAGQRVRVRPGLYQTGMGEVFPLEVPDTVQLLGDEPTKGNGSAAVRLEGGGPVDNVPALRATVVLGTGSVLAGFLVVNPPGLPGAHGVVITGQGGADDAIVRNNTIAMGGGDGIYVNDGEDATIVGNVVANQDSGTGIRITDGGAGAVLQENVVLSNQYGVEINAAADLGGGGLSFGGNVFSCNDENDLVVAGPVASVLTVSAMDNSWDHVPPTTGCGSNIDLCAQNAQVSTPGASLAPNSCP